MDQFSKGWTDHFIDMRKRVNKYEVRNVESLKIEVGREHFKRKTNIMDGRHG